MSFYLVCKLKTKTIYKEQDFIKKSYLPYIWYKFIEYLTIFFFKFDNIKYLDLVDKQFISHNYYFPQQFKEIIKGQYECLNGISLYEVVSGSYKYIYHI